MFNRIQVVTSPIADSRTCDAVTVTKDELLESSYSHARDVRSAMNFLVSRLLDVADRHDYTKITEIDMFHKDFTTLGSDPGNHFKDGDWYQLHLTERHHLLDALPEDVNLLDVLEMLIDGTVSGAARTGVDSVFSPKIPSSILQIAVKNTVKMLVEAIDIVDSHTNL